MDNPHFFDASYRHVYNHICVTSLLACTALTAIVHPTLAAPQGQPLTANQAVASPSAAKTAQPLVKSTTPTKAVTKSAPGAAVLAYRFQPGETHRYRVVAFFDGHFPPFAQPGSRPIHVYANIEYVYKVLKVDAEGAEVAFTVENEDMSLLVNEVPEGGKVNHADEVPLPVTPEDLQKALNTTVVLRPDGSIARVVSSGPNMIKVNIGFDLRKLFLLMMPITFPSTALHMGDTWSANEGILGVKVGKIGYNNRVAAVTPDGGNRLYQITQTGSETVDEKLDQAGNSTDKPADFASTLNGTVTVDSIVKFLAPSPTSSSGPTAGRTTVVQLTLKALLERKTLPPSPQVGAGPDSKNLTPKPKSDIPVDGPIDVKARMLVKLTDPPQKKTIKTTASKTGVKN